MMIVGPEKNGKLNQSDLQAFGTSSCRMFGEMQAVLERDLLKPLFAAYSKHRDAYRTTGVENAELAEKFNGIMSEIMRQIQGTLPSQTQVCAYVLM
jgi:hypothetical protein